MVRRLLILLAVSFPLCLTAAAHAAQSDISRYVLPPGNYGGIPTNSHSLDQLPLYSGLTPLRRNVSMSDVFHFYLPMNFKPIGATQNEPVGRSDVTVTYDAYGIPHIKGKTRAGHDVRRGLGDGPRPRAAVQLRPRAGPGRRGRHPRSRRVLAGHERHPVRAQPRRPRRSSPSSARSSSAPTVRRAGRCCATWRTTPTGSTPTTGPTTFAFPGGRPFDANDVIAVTAFIGSIFGNGGGVEHENSDLLARFERKLGVQRGHAMWSDAMEANDPDAPVTTHKRFPYPTLTGGKVTGSVVIDPGSIQLAKDPADRRARARWSHLGATPPTGSSWRRGARPPVGRWPSWARSSATTTPRSSTRSSSRAPGIDAQGVAASGIGLYLLIGRTRNYAWSLTSAGNDNEDVFAEKLCVPGGGKPTRASLSLHVPRALPGDAHLRRRDASGTRRSSSR